MTASWCYNGPAWTIVQDVGLPSGGAYMLWLGILWWFLICVFIQGCFKRWKVEKPSVTDSRLNRVMKSKEAWYRAAFLLVSCVWGLPIILFRCRNCKDGQPDFCGNWIVLWVYGVFFILTSSISTRPLDFYLGEGVTIGDYWSFYIMGRPIRTTEEIETAALSKNRVDSGTADYQVGFFTLCPSVFVTWVFAKSIYNSATLGGEYGMLGGLAYAGWYVSFFSVGFVCYILRVRFGYKSLSSCIYSNYGTPGVICYQAAVLFRVWNEVWSNATVIGGFFGPAGSDNYWGAAWLSSFIPLVYAVMGGMRASLVSDIIQAFMGIIFLTVVLFSILGDAGFQSAAGTSFNWTPTTLYPATGSWKGGWWAAFIGGTIQGLCSYPFFDPILTDRAFLSRPKTMLISFIVGGVIAAGFIFFYSAIGVYGAYYNQLYASVCGCGMKNPVATSACPTAFNACFQWSTTRGSPQYASYILGRQTYRVVEYFITITMITASMASVDSAYTSCFKLVSLDFGGYMKLKGDDREELAPLRPHDVASIGPSHMLLARLSSIPLLITSIVFLGVDKDAMTATSAAGTMVMGIGAPIWFSTLWLNKRNGKRGFVQAPLAFVGPFIIGIIFGSYYYTDGLVGYGTTYDTWTLGDPSYGYSRFLGTNLYGHLICLVAFIVFFGFHQLFPQVWFWKLEPVEDLQDQPRELSPDQTFVKAIPEEPMKVAAENKEPVTTEVNEDKVQSV